MFNGLLAQALGSDQANLLNSLRFHPNNRCFRALEDRFDTQKGILRINWFIEFIHIIVLNHIPDFQIPRYLAVLPMLAFLLNG